MGSKGFTALLCIKQDDENDGNEEEGEACEEQETEALYSAFLALSFNVITVFLMLLTGTGDENLKSITENVGYTFKCTLVGNQHKQCAEHEYHTGNGKCIAENAVALGSGGGFGIAVAADNQPHH